MSIEVWILLLIIASGVSGALGYLFARRNAPSRSDIESLEAELETARSNADSVQSSVNVHFEQSATLFGKLAQDYREFLEHFESSAQSLGLSESRARELLEQGFQPLLTHEEEAIENPAEAEAAGDGADAGDEVDSGEVDLPGEADTIDADALGTDKTEEPGLSPESDQHADDNEATAPTVVAVDLPERADAAGTDRGEDDAPPEEQTPKIATP